MSPFRLARKHPLPTQPAEANALTDSGADALERRWLWRRRFVMTPIKLACAAPLWATLALYGAIDSLGWEKRELALLMTSSAGLLMMFLFAHWFFEVKQTSIQRLGKMSDHIREECVALIKSNPKARALAENAKAQGRDLRGFDLAQMRRFESDRQSLRLNRDFDRLARSTDPGDKA